MARGFKPVALLAARAANQKKGEDIFLLDVRKTHGLTDYVLLVSVLSPAHLEAIEEDIRRVMRTAGVRLLHWDGSNGASWRALDFGGLIVHLLHEKAREFYQLDKLYHDSPKLKWLERSTTRAAKSRERLQTRRHVA